MPGGMVYLYKESATTPFAPDKYRMDPVQAWDIAYDGSFSFHLPAGTYYLEAVQRSPEVGPPQKNELRLIGLDEEGKPKPYTVKNGEHLEIGDLSGLKRYEGLRIENIKTGITGMVLDKKNRPVTNTAVFAYAKPDMAGLALFISDKTGADGRYVLGLAEGGAYYLKVLDFTPFPPETFGIHGGAEPAPVTVNTGRIKQDINFIDQ